MSETTVEQVPVNVEICGHGQPLVLIHGWGMNRHCWANVVPILAQHFELHLVDLPGFGDSQPVQGKLNLPRMTQAVAEVLPDQAIVMGWSLGGLVATQLALLLPQKVKALVQVCSSVKFEAAEGWPGIDAKVLKSFQQALATDFEKTVDRFLAIQAMGAPSAKTDIQHIRKMLEKAPQPQLSALSDGLQMLHDVDLRSQLEELKAPILRLYGRLDSLVPKAVIPLMDELLPASQAHTFKTASHAPFISYPIEFCDVLKNWLNEL